MRRFFLDASVAAAALAIALFWGHARCAAQDAYYAGGKRDPFIPLITKGIKASLGLQSVESIEDIKFEGVVFDPNGLSVAMLNGEIVREGDRICNVEVVRIYDDSIIIKIYAKEYKVSLAEEGGRDN